jgi:hypothetical protein
VAFDAEGEWSFVAETSHHRAIFRPVEETLLVDLLENARAAEPQAGAPPGHDARGPAPARHMTVTQRMVLELHNHPEYISRTQREWANALGCSPSTINDAPAWKTILRLRANNEADRRERSDPP